jgi:predicted deacylase
VGNDSEYFSENYAAARKRFLTFSGALVRATQPGEFQVPSETDDDLFVDDVYMPPKQVTETLIVLTSGVHGMEAAAGSALQLMFMNELVPRLDLQRTGIYLLHCFNPYGFKHDRRSTQSNVNLNRNFALNPFTFKTPNTAYDKIAHLFESEKPVSPPLIPLTAALGIVLSARKSGLNAAALNQAIGQVNSIIGAGSNLAE